MKTTRTTLVALLLIGAMLPGCDRFGHREAEKVEHEPHVIWLTSPKKQDVTMTREYVCQIRSCRHIDICPLESGYLQAISVQEGQRVQKGDPLFRILPALYQARLDAEKAEAQVARIEFDNTKKLVSDEVVSPQELALAEAKLAKAEARMKLASVELDFTTIRAPFDGIIDRLHEQEGSLVDEGDVLTTLSDNSLMWVYFNVPEARYLEYVAEKNDPEASRTIELVLANGRIFPHKGAIGAIEADFNNETGNIAFRADFPNPSYLLRHGQTGKVLIHRKVPDALVIPQRVIFSILAKRYVYVVDDDDVVHQREIVIEHEEDDIFVVRSGLAEGDRIVLEGVAQVRDGQRIGENEFRSPDEVLADQKFHAE